MGAADAPPAKRRPNVVVFVVDDLGSRDLGYAGSTFYESPNVDALARRGAVFTSAYAACPVCSPTRAALLTGRYPARVGVTDYIGGPQPDAAAARPIYQDRLLPAPYKEQLALDETTVAEALKEAGYATFFGGKWHLGRERYYPDKQGFETMVGASYRGSPGKGGYFSPYQVPLSPGPEGEHLDLRLASEAAQWIEKQSSEKPFLLWMSWYDVHTPLMAPAETIKYFEEKKKKLELSDRFATEGASKLRLTQAHTTYAAMVKTMDEAVGIVVKQLESQKLLDDTIILFTSDNGGVATSEGWPTSNAPLRAGKGWAYEGGIRVPLIAVIPGVTRPGQTCDAPSISTDVFPTLLAACGLEQRPKDHLDGINLLPALRGEASPDRPLFWHYPHYGNQGGSPFSAIRSGDWKLIAFHEPKHSAELYNLAEDPQEKQNVAGSNEPRVQELRAALEAWKRSVGAVDATAHPNAATPAK
ncbi:MAG: sulfatase [Planctomycetota bacterium]|nr:sulfatase [Planctomycetota bacterium]